VIGIILAIVLPLTLKKKNPDDPQPTPPEPTPPSPSPVDPFTYKEFKPYAIKDGSVVKTTGSVSFQAV
jgi:hypothetical protein